VAGLVTKGQIGYEDIATGTSTFTRVTSVGGSQTLHQLPFTVAGGNMTILGTSTLGPATINTATLNTATLTSPVINGTPSGTGIPTTTFKSGSNAGAYSTSNTSLVDVDATNLALTVTIPLGWKLVVFANGVVTNATAIVGVVLAIYDSVANAAVGAPVNILAGSTSSNGSFFTQAVINGDGNSHTVKLRWETASGSDAAQMTNSNGIFPGMMFILMPSN
jgi:hypothetical protein